MNCCIIDDEITAVTLVSRFAERTPGLSVVCAETNPLVALDKINRDEIQVDMMFLDVDMPELKGTKLPQLLHKKIPIIFTTAHKKYALDAFNLNVVDFLHKPFSYERFLQGVAKATEVVIRDKDPVASKPEWSSRKKVFRSHVYIKPGGKGRFTRVELKDVIVMESRNNVLLMKVENEKEDFKTKYALEEIIHELNSERFMRVHRSYIVNLEKIKSVISMFILLINGQSVPIGESYKDAVMEMIRKESFSYGKSQAEDD